jgi:uncharacterized membrane protein
MFKNIKQISLASLFVAITLLLGFSRIGYIPLPTPAGAATIMHIPVILAGILMGPWFGALVGSIFGLSAVMYFSYIAPFWVLFPARPFIGIVSGLVYNFLSSFFGSQKKLKNSTTFIISLVVFSFSYLSGIYIMREWFSESLINYSIEFSFLIALIAFIIAFLILFFIKEKEGEIVAIGIASFLGSMTNTIGTLGLAAIFKIFPLGVIISIGILQGIPEAIIASIICPPIVIVLKRLFKENE